MSTGCEVVAVRRFYRVVLRQTVRTCLPILDVENAVAARVLPLHSMLTHWGTKRLAQQHNLFYVVLGLAVELRRNLVGGEAVPAVVAGFAAARAMRIGT